MTTLPKAFQAFKEKYPDVAKAYDDLGEAVRRAGPLSDREIHLVKLAIAVGARLEGAVHSHTRRAIEAGLKEEELRQVALLSITTIGLPGMMQALTWINDHLS